MTVDFLPISADRTLEYVRSRGFDPGESARATPITEGVSALVVLIEGAEHRWIVKQSLPQLLTASEWRASPRRALTEASAMRVLHEITPANVPELVDVDSERFTVMMTAAPRELTNWRTTLLTDELSSENVTDVAARLGRVLAAWHSQTWMGTPDPAFFVRADFDDEELFDQLRLAPFHRTIRTLHPHLHAITACIDELEASRECLVHGDFSPKNILSRGSESWVVDFEVATIGASVFDLAFLGHHLVLKALVRPRESALLRSAFDEFIGAYTSSLNHPSSIQRLGWHIASLLLARVDGVSRASYLSIAEADRARTCAVAALRSGDARPQVIWDLVTGTTKGPIR